MTAPSSLVTTGDPGHAVAEHNPVAAFPHDSRGGISNPILGMLLFICSEVMFFSGLFAAYFSVRAASIHWPPTPLGMSSIDGRREHPRGPGRAFQPACRAVVRGRPDPDPGPELGDLPARRVGDPAG